MELMKLVAKLQLDDSGYRSGLDSAEAKGAQFTKGLSAMTVAAGQIIADIAMKTVAAIKDMIGGAIDAFADYQQLVGGIETLFKSSSGKMEEYAKNSFRTTGLSANKYMETAMSFSATLLQGVKGDTEKAADYTNMAILDMSDNANKMGTDMGLLQNAYAGFAKRNYTMLDNLKLGYGGTESEMIRLVNDSHILDHEITSLDEITFDQLILAIHTVQTEMGITGTTAKEAEETITGSAASMKAAWEDMLVAVAGGGDQSRLDEAMRNFQDAFATYMENFIPTLTTTIMNSGTLVEVIAESIAALPSTLMAKLTQAGLGAGADLFHGAEVLMNWIIDSLANVIQDLSIDSSRMEKFGYSLGHFLGNTVSKIMEKLPELLPKFFEIGLKLAGGILAGIWDGLFGSGKSEVDEINEKLTEDILDIERSTMRADAILDYMQSLVNKYGDAAKETAEWKQAEKDLEQVLEGSGSIFEKYGQDVNGAIGYLRDMNHELRDLAIQNAVLRALEDEDTLIAEKTIEIAKSNARAGEAQELIDNYTSGRRTMLLHNVQAYAGEMADLSNPEYVDPEVIRYYRNLSAGYIEDPFSGEKQNIESMREDELIDLLTEIVPSLRSAYDTNDTNERDTVWGRNVDDDIKSWEEIQAMDAEVEKARNTVKEEAEKRVKLEEELADLEKDRAVIARASEDIMREQYEKQNAAANLMSMASDQIVAGLQNSASKISSISFEGGSGGWWDNLPPNAWAPKAIGMDYVPYDGFRAELHRGEAVLTAQQNADRGRSAFDMEYALENAVRSGMSGMYLNMDGNRVADMTTRRTRRNISANEHARVRAMGG